MESFCAERAAIIYNPAARGLLGRLHLLQNTVSALANQGIQADLIATIGPGSASLQARRSLDAGCDLVVAAGGDGTVNEVANGMLHSRVPLAVFPGGTANVLAHEIGLPLHLERAAIQLRNLRPCRIAMGTLRAGDLGRRCFLCMAGAGLDAEIVSRINPNLKIAIGKLAYYAGGFAQVLRPLREFEVIVDGQPYQASFALISRVRNYGGDLEIARGASLLRNDFEVVLFRGTFSARYLHYLLGVTLRRADRMKGCTVLRGSSIVCNGPNANEIGASQIYVQLDGELAGNLPISAEIVPDALTLLVPPGYLVREQSYVAVPAYA